MKMGKVYKKRVLAALLALLMSMSQTMPVFASDIPSNVAVTSITEEGTPAETETVLEEGESEDVESEDTITDEADSEKLSPVEDGTEDIISDESEEVSDTVSDNNAQKETDEDLNEIGFIGEEAVNDGELISGDLRYIVTDEGEITITGHKDGSSATGPLSIPEEIDNKPVTKIADNAFFICSGFTGSLTIPNSVTTIGDNAFYDCSGFTGSLTIPDSVTTIGENAFRGCRGFTGSLTLGNSVTTIGNYAFDECRGFTESLTIPNSVTTIGERAFSNCGGFTGNLTIGNNVQTIGKYAFSNCGGFTGSLTIPNSVTTIGEKAFYNCSGFNGSLTLGNSVTTIGDYAFQGCSGFTGSLTIPNSVTTIGDYAFSGCNGFTGILTIPGSVTTIGDYAFSGCSGFTKLTNNSTQTMPVSDFWSNDMACFTDANGVEYRTGNLPANGTYERKLKSLTGVSLDETSISIKSSEIKKLTATILPPNAYNKKITWSSSDPSIAKVDANGTVKGIKSGTATITATTEAGNHKATCTVYVKPYVYQNVQYELNEDGTQAIAVGYVSEASGDLTIADTIGGCPVTAIKECAFLGASDFTGSLTIGNSVTTIGEEAFCNCSGLMGSLVIPDSVTTIEDYAFCDCSGFDGSLTIGNSVTTIGELAFDGCNGFTGSLTLPSSVTTILDFAFASCSGFGGSLTIGNSVTTIGKGAFDGCSGFTGSLTIPNSVTTIGEGAFFGCSGFTGSLTIGSNVTTIGNAAFNNCSGFTGNLTIPNSVKTIEEEAFFECSGFTGSLTIGNSVTTIGNSAFSECSGFTKLTNNSAQTLPVSWFSSDDTECFTDANGTEYRSGNLPANGTYERKLKSLRGVSLDETSISIKSSEIKKLTATILPPNAYNKKITWSSSNPSIAKVDANGTVKGIKRGTATITATTEAGNLKATCTVTVGPFVYQNVQYELNEDGTEAIAVGYVSGASGDLTIADTIGGCPVTAIKEGAFLGASNFTGSLTIGNSVTTIGEAAFYSCSGFTGSLTLPNSVTTIGEYAFRECSGFTGSLTIGNSVTTIDGDAFYDCSGFTKLTNNSAQTLPVSWFSSDDTECFTDANGVEYRSGDLPANGIYERKLKTLTGLSLDETYVTIKASESKKLTATILPPNAYNKKITWSSSAPSIAKVDANGNVKGIKSGETVITAKTITGNLEASCTVTVEPYVYQNVKYELNEDGTQAIAVGYVSGASGDLTIADTIGGCPVTTIGNYAFWYFSGFTGSLTIPNSVTTIGDYAFAFCSSFTGSLTIGNSVTTIGEAAFYSCSGFTGSLTIPNSVKTIGDYAFYGCNGFTGSLVIPNSVTTIGEYAFYECNGFTGSLTIGNSVKTIGDYAFYGCNGFTGSLVIPNSVTTIEEGAFYNCGGFTGDLVIPGSVTEIGGVAFYGCSGLTGSLTVGNNVEEVGDRAFNGCYKISSVINNSAATLNVNDFWKDNDPNTVCFTDETGKEYSRNDTFSKGTFKRRITPESVSLGKDSLSVYIGKTDTVSATVSPVNAYDKVTYSSSKPEIATVNNDGVITGVAKGEAVITVTTVSGKKTANCTVTVKQRDKIDISINGGVDKTVTYGDADFSLSKSVKGAGEGTGVWTWSSSNTDVATVNATTGLISIKNAGTTIIKAKYETEITEGEAEITLTVKKADMSTAEITLGKALTYNGSEQTQAVSKVELNKKTVPATSYTVTGNKVTNAGSYTLTVTANADSNYTGSKTVSFSVAKLAVTPVVTVTGDYSFTGKAITPKFSVKYDGKDMPADEYTATLENNINAGTAKLTVTASQNGNYSFDPMTTEFAIAKAKALTLSDITKEQGYYVKDISATVNGLMPEVAGTLSYIAGEPQVTKVNGSTTKISNFTVDESGKVSAAVTDGTAGDVITLPVTITSTNYADSTVNVAVTLTKQVEGLAVYGIEDKTYTGSKITQDLTVFYDGEQLIEKTDYTVAYKNNINTGKATVTITGKGDYDGKKNYEFEILPANIADAAVEVNAVTDTGTAKKPAVKATVSYLGKKLTNKDYTIEVDWNAPEIKKEKATVRKIETEIEVTYYPVKIKATTVATKGKTINFVGENTSAKLKVYPKGNKAVTDASYVNLKNGSIEIVGGNKYTYTGTSITPEIKVYAGKGDKKGEAIDPSSYKVTYSANTNKGTAKITVSGIESKGYMGSVSASFSIAALSITSDKISVKLDEKIPFSKGGAKPVPVVSIKLPDGSDKVLREGVDYTLSYANNAAAGVTGDKTPKLTITGKGNLSGKRTAGFVIETKDIASVKIVTKDKEVKANAKGDYFKSKPELYDIDGKKLAENKDYTVAYITADGKPIDKTTVLEDGATVTVKITGKGNYTGEVTATYSIRKIYDLSKTAYDKIADKQYTGKAIRPDNEIKLYTKTGSGKQIKKEYLTSNDYEILTCFNNVKKGTATYILKGKGRFSGYKVVTFKIVKAKFNA